MRRACCHSLCDLRQRTPMSRFITPNATKLRTPLSDFNAVANKEARLRGPFTLVTQAALLNGPSLAIVFCPVLAPLATSLPNRSLTVRARAIATSLRLRM